MKGLYFIISIFMIGGTLCLTGCFKDRTSKKEGYAFLFVPRTCDDLLLIPAKREKRMEPGGTSSLNTYTIGATAVPAASFQLYIFTGDYTTIDYIIKRFNDDLNKADIEFVSGIRAALNIKSDLAPHKPAIEQQLESDYRRYYSSGSSFKNNDYLSDITTTVPRFNLMSWQYRVTGISDFSITANQTLFNKPAGTNLSEAFIISSFYPTQIVSYTNDQLVWGYNDTKKIESISQWLSLKPYAPPMIALKMATIPADLPDETDFTITITTTDGKIIKETTHVKFAK